MTSTTSQEFAMARAKEALHLCSLPFLVLSLCLGEMWNKWSLCSALGETLLWGNVDGESSLGDWWFAMVDHGLAQTRPTPSYCFFFFFFCVVVFVHPERVSSLFCGLSNLGLVVGKMGFMRDEIHGLLWFKKISFSLETSGIFFSSFCWFDFDGWFMDGHDHKD